MRYLTAALLGCLLALTSFAFAGAVVSTTPDGYVVKHDAQGAHAPAPQAAEAHPDNDGRLCGPDLAATAAGRAACSYARDLNDCAASPATCAGRGYGAAYSSRARLDS